MDYNEFSNHKIEIYNDYGQIIKTYSGRMHIFSDTDKNGSMRCIHFVDEEKHHYKIYSNNLIIVEEI